MVNVLLVDDHKLVRAGIMRILNDAPGVKVIGDLNSGEEAIHFVRQRKPDVVLMDVQMPGIGGFEATRKLLKSDSSLKIIILSVCADEPFPSRLLQSGAAGYLTKGCSPEEIINAIKCVHKGQRYVGADIAQHLALSLLSGSGDASPIDALSNRELQVMLMVAQGKKTPEISDELCLSPKTISTYRYRLFEKLRIHSDAELTHVALRYGLLDESHQEMGE